MSDPGTLDGVGIAVLAAGLYLLLSQRTGYGDGPGMLLQIREHHIWSSPSHFLFIPLVAGLHALLAPLGLSLPATAAGLSALGTATGVLLMHAASRGLGLARDRAALAAALTATCPGVLFFATVVEMPGPFLAFVGLGAVGLARLVQRPTIGHAATLGAATGLAYCVHATGNLLPGVFGLLFLALAGGSPARLAWPARLRLLAVVVAVHAIVVVAVPFALRRSTGAGASNSFALDFFLQYARSTLAAGVDPLKVLLREWVWPMLPVSVLWLLAFTRRRERALGAALLASLLPYALLAILVVGRLPEHGAYLLPLAWPAALLTARVLPPVLLLAALACGLTAGVAEVRGHARPERSAGYAAGVRELAGGAPVYLLMGGKVDVESCALRLSDTDYLSLPALAVLDAATLEGLLPRLEAELAQRLARGERVYLTAGADALLRSERFSANARVAARLLAFLEERFALRTVQAHGFRARELRQR